MSPETGSSHTLVLDTKSSEAVYTVVSFVEMATSLAHEVIARYETDHDAVVQIHEAGERGTTYSIYRLNSVREQQIPNYLTFSAEGFLIQAIFQSEEGYAYYRYYPDVERLTVMAKSHSDQGGVRAFNLRMNQNGNAASITANETHEFIEGFGFNMNYHVLDADLSLGSVTFGSGFWLPGKDRDSLFPYGRDLDLEDLLNLVIDPSAWIQSGWRNLPTISETPGLVDFYLENAVGIELFLAEGPRSDFPKIEGVVFPAKSDQSVWKAIAVSRPSAGKAKTFVLDVVVGPSRILIDDGNEVVFYEIHEDDFSKGGLTVIEQTIREYVEMDSN